MTGVEVCKVGEASASIEVTEAVANQRAHKELLKDKDLSPLVQVCSEKGNNDWLQAKSRYIPSPQFTLMIMARLGLAHSEMPNTILCPGCKMILEAKNALPHFLGCVKCFGSNATTRHNALVRHIYDLCLKAGLPCEREPRQFSTFRCVKCAETVADGQKLHHQRKCGTHSFHRSGPDLVVFWATGEVYYDLTVVNELAKSHLGKKAKSPITRGSKKESRNICGLQFNSARAIRVPTVPRTRKIRFATSTKRKNYERSRNYDSKRINKRIRVGESFEANLRSSGFCSRNGDQRHVRSDV